VVGVDGEVLSCFCVGEPRKLHDRTPSGVEDDPFDLAEVASTR